MARLNPEQAAEMLAQYQTRETTVEALCRHWGIGVATLHRYRRMAGIDSRFQGSVWLPAEPDSEEAPLLPVLGTIRLTKGCLLVPTDSLPASCFEEVPDGQS